MDQFIPIDEIRDNIACAKCGYNLRGLRGPIVTCPECGWQCDLVTLVKRKWTEPWWKAPGFNALIVPTIWLLGFLVPAAICGLTFLLIGDGWSYLILAFVLFATGIVVWARSLAEVNRWWPGLRGVLLSTLTIGAVILDVLLVISALVALLFFLRSLLGVNHPEVFTVGSIVFTVGSIVGLVLSTSVTIMLFIGARRLQRYIATQCITRYLNGPADQA